MSYFDEVLADAPEVYWRLGESIGETTAVDSSGENEDGTYVGDITLESDSLLVGDPNTSAYFSDAVTQYVESQNDFGDTTYPEFTLECLVNIDNIGQFGNMVALVDPTFDHWIDVYANGDPVDGEIGIYFDFGGELGSYESIGGSVPVVPVEETLHVAATYDGVDLRLYVNGVVLQENPANPGAVADFAGVEAHVYVGGDASGFPDGFFGRIDEAAFYLHALDEDRVFAHYNASLGGGLSINSLDPETMDLEGGSLAIIGVNFVDVTSVTIDGVSVAFTVVNANLIIATAQAHVAGSVLVVVTTTTASDSILMTYGDLTEPPSTSLLSGRGNPPMAIVPIRIFKQ